MNASIKLLMVSLLFATLVFRATAEIKLETRSYSYYNGKRYEFMMTGERQARCPKWDSDKADNPPYPAAKALAQAKKFIAGIPTPEKTFWELEDLALVYASGGWAWRARYYLSSVGGSSGAPQTMDCWILMDGTRVEPIITEDRNR